MGTFEHPLEIVSADGDRYERLDAVVDTGTMYSWVPGSILRSLGFEPALTRPFVVADGMTIERGLSVIRVRIDDETLPTLVIFGDEGSLPVLGRITLEEFGLSVDPAKEKLVRESPPSQDDV